MPRRLAVTGMREASVLHYEDGALGEKDVLVRTEIASGKHGTTFAMFDGRTFAGKFYDAERHLFMDADEDAERRPPSPENPWGTGTSGYGRVEARWRGRFSLFSRRPRGRADGYPRDQYRA